MVIKSSRLFRRPLLKFGSLAPRPASGPYASSLISFLLPHEQTRILISHWSQTPAHFQTVGFNPRRRAVLLSEYHITHRIRTYHTLISCHGLPVTYLHQLHVFI